jgi:hypothetical protein
VSSAFKDEFTVPDNYSMADVKSKVKAWNASPYGADYVMEVKHDRHILLTKTKHDMKLCFVPCVVPFISIPVMFLGLGAGPAGFFFGFIMWLIIVVVAELWAVYTFCLNPKKAEYEIMFSNETPIRVHVYASGEIAASAHEYKALRDTLYGGTRDQGVGLEF